MFENNSDRPSSASEQENRRQIRRFLVIGLISVATDYLVYLFLCGPLFLITSVAKGLSYVAGMAVGYAGNKYWTFGSTRRSAAEPVAYVAVYAVTLVVNIMVNSAVLGTLGWSLLAFLVATATTMVLNFLGLRLIAFRTGINERLAAEGARLRGPHTPPVRQGAPTIDGRQR